MMIHFLSGKRSYNDTQRCTKGQNLQRSKQNPIKQSCSIENTKLQKMKTAEKIVGGFLKHFLYYKMLTKEEYKKIMRDCVIKVYDASKTKPILDQNVEKLVLCQFAKYQLKQAKLLHDYHKTTTKIMKTLLDEGDKNIKKKRYVIRKN